MSQVLNVRVCCPLCNGSRKIVGFGMMIKECQSCKDRDIVHAQPVNIKSTSIGSKKVVIDKRSKAYRSAIAQIQESNPEMTREDAVAAFDHDNHKSDE